MPPVEIFLWVLPTIFGFSLIPTVVILFIFFEILLIRLASFIDSILINSTPFLIASFISSSVFPTPEKTIFLTLIPAFIAFNISPAETTSAPDPIFFNSLSKVMLELDLTEKQTKGLAVLNALLKALKLFFN